MSMSDVAVVILLVLLGVVAGAVLPTILQARRAFRAAETWFEGTGRKIDRLADDAEGLLANLREIADAAAQLRGAVRACASIGTMLGPAVAEGLRAAFTRGPEEVQEDEGRTSSAIPIESTRKGDSP